MPCFTTDLTGGLIQSFRESLNSLTKITYEDLWLFYTLFFLFFQQ
jgi:hypothetical protein